MSARDIEDEDEWLISEGNFRAFLKAMGFPPAMIEDEVSQRKAEAIARETERVRKKSEREA